MTPAAMSRLSGIVALVGLACLGSILSAQEPAKSPAPRLPRIVVSRDKSHFVREGADEPFEAWGFNYDHDADGRLLEDYWETEWDRVVGDFREMKALGANVVRVHLQTGRFLLDADHPNTDNLARLAKLVKLAEETGLYLDVTGLGCYHKADVPAWYAAPDEAARWAAQARFWTALAGVCKDSPAIFCYDLMNEPILTGGDDKGDWLPGKPLGDKHFVQRITLDARGRSDREIASAWVRKLTSAIREVDPRTMITVGVIPWAQVFPGAKPLFYAPEVAGPLDFVSVHLYPRKDKLDDDLKALKVYEVGKPLVIEEIFPLQAGFEGTEEFIKKSRSLADGYISFYWGKTIADYEQGKDLNGAIVGGWLKRFQALAPSPTKSAVR